MIKKLALMLLVMVVITICIAGLFVLSATDDPAEPYDHLIHTAQDMQTQLPAVPPAVQLMSSRSFDYNDMDYLNRSYQLGFSVRSEKDLATLLTKYKLTFSGFRALATEPAFLWPTLGESYYSWNDPREQAQKLSWIEATHRWTLHGETEGLSEHLLAARRLLMSQPSVVGLNAQLALCRQEWQMMAAWLVSSGAPSFANDGFYLDICPVNVVNNAVRRAFIMDFSRFPDRVHREFMTDGDLRWANDMPKIKYTMFRPNRIINDRRFVIEETLELLQTPDVEREDILDEALGYLSMRTFDPIGMTMSGNFLGLDEYDYEYRQFPNLETLRQAICTEEALRLVCSLLRYRRQHGEYPDRLENLGEAVLGGKMPVDPYSMKSFRYDKTRKRFWSVGPDRKDDGGGTVAPDPFVLTDPAWELR